MIIRALDSNGDWTFGNGIGDYKTLIAAIDENIQTRLKEWVGDCFFNQNAGIDWLTRLSSKNQLELLKADLKRVIATSFGVTAIISFNVTQVGRHVTASYTCQSIYSNQFSSTLILGA
jgi:hypothetical protein